MKLDCDKAFENASNLRYKGLCVMVESRCNAKCGYCITKQETPQTACDACKKNGCSVCAKDRIADDNFIEKLWPFLKNTYNPQYQISVTGGEPTLSSRIWQTLAEINQYYYRAKILLTNGAGLYAAKDGKTLAEYLAETGWGIVLHRDHWKSDVNNSLMGCNGLTENQVLGLTQIFQGRLSINCVLQSKGIASAVQILDYCEYAKEHWGNVSIEFSEMQFDSRAATAKEKNRYRSQIVKASAIRQALLTMGYKESYLAESDKALYSVFKQLNCAVCSCDIEKMNERATDEERCLILYPDGEAGWYT